MLGPDRDHGIRTVLGSTRPNPPAESEGIRDDLIAAAWGEGPAFPTAAEELWRGRTFWRTDITALFVYTGQGWRQLDVPTAWSGPALVGKAWDGVSTLRERVGHVLLTASVAGTGNTSFDFATLANGLLHADVQIIDGTAATAKVRWSGSSPASTLSKLELHLTRADGSNVAASSPHRLSYRILGW